MVSDFLQARRILIIQFIKYGVAGSIATLTHVAVFYLMNHFVLDAVSEAQSRATRFHHFFVDTTVAFLMGNTVAYLLNIKYVFIPGRHGRKTEITLFFLVSGVSFVLGTLLAGMMIKKFAMNSHLTQAAFVVTAVLVNYVCRKFIIFHG